MVYCHLMTPTICFEIRITRKNPKDLLSNFSAYVIIQNLILLDFPIITSSEDVIPVQRGEKVQQTRMFLFFVHTNNFWKDNRKNRTLCQEKAYSSRCLSSAINQDFSHSRAIGHTYIRYLVGYVSPTGCSIYYWKKERSKALWPMCLMRPYRNRTLEHCKSICSIDNLVASWFKWLWMTSNDSKWLQLIS